ncbi:MAG: hypothetical protein V4706_03635 [Pseudomonadota bacterium]
MNEAFFIQDNVMGRLGVVEAKTNVQPSKDPSEKLRNLHSAIKIIRANPAEFDRNCQTNIEWIGSSFSEALATYASSNTPVDEVDDIYSLVYRFVVEFDLSVKNDLSMELRKFKTFTHEHYELFNEQAQAQMKFAVLEMPIAIMKQLLGSDALRNVRHMEKYTGEIENKIKRWDEGLADYERKANILKESLSSYATGFNFVGLYEGFDQLSTVKVKELAAHRKWLLLFGLLAVLPITAEFLIVSWNLDRIVEMRWALLIGAIPILPLTVLFVYFFRIVLRSFEGTKSQLLQLELRKTLCRFIQKYAEYSKTLKESNIDSLNKFESIIFSGLVSSEEKLPATFDGLEQLTNMVKAFQSK